MSPEAVEQLPYLFKVIEDHKRKCCIQKECRWYNGRHLFLSALQTADDKQNCHFNQEYTYFVTKGIEFKALVGRGKSGRSNLILSFHNSIQS